MRTHAGRHVPAALGAQETLHWRAQVVAELVGPENAHTMVTGGHRVAGASGEEDRPLLGREHCEPKVPPRAEGVKRRGKRQQTLAAEQPRGEKVMALTVPPRYVLGGTAMPAILIEIGFVTNPKEERKLRDPRYRGHLLR